VSMPLIPPFAITAGYQNSQYANTNPYVGGSQVFSHLVNPPSTGTNAETVSNNNAHAEGFTGFSAANEVVSLALSGGPATSGSFFLEWNGAVTAAIAWNAVAAAVQTAINALPGMTYGTNAVQSVTVTGGPTGGGFTLTTGGQTTASIPYNATNFQVQSALAALSSVGLNNVVVTGPPGGPFNVTFQNAKGNQPITLMTSANTFTGGTTPGVTVANVTVGVGPTPNTVVTGGPLNTAPFVITFGGQLASQNINPFSADSSLLLPAGAIVVPTVTTQGQAAFTNQALLNQKQQYDGMVNFYQLGSGNHF
jgi:hypothetical protein